MRLCWPDVLAQVHQHLSVAIPDELAGLVSRQHEALFGALCQVSRFPHLGLWFGVR